MPMLDAFLTEMGLSEGLQEQMRGIFRRQTYERGKVLLQPGQTADWLGLVESGLVQSFYDRDGEELTTYLAGAGKLVVALKSFLRAVPSQESLRCLSPTVLWVAGKADWEALKADNAEFQAFYTGLLEYQLVCIEESRYDFITLTAEERYAKMLETEPHVLQEMPLQYLAQVLGVTPRHLSRIRAQVR